MIPVSRPDFDKETEQDLIEVLRSGWVGNGPKVKEFEQKFADYVGARYAVATNSATSALDLCLKAYDIKGGELLTTPFTFVSDAVVGEWNDMEVSFADIDPYTFCLDPLPMDIRKETKAIIAVDSHGRLADFDEIRRICGRHKPLIIEDAAHATGTPNAGKGGDIAVWSFQAVKVLPIFDGGMITTDDEGIAEKIKSLSWLGVSSTYSRVGKKGYTWDYDILTGDGIKGYMTDVQAILGIGQLRRMPEVLKKRQAIQERYNEAFRKYDWFKEPEFSHTVQYYTASFFDRDGLSKHLTEKEIATSVHFKPLSEMTYWKKAIKREMPNLAVWKNLLSLPVFFTLTEKEQDYIIKSVVSYYE